MQSKSLKVFLVALLLAMLLVGGIPSWRQEAIDSTNALLKASGYQAQLKDPISPSHARFGVGKGEELRELNEGDGEGFNKVKAFHYPAKKEKKP